MLYCLRKSAKYSQKFVCVCVWVKDTRYSRDKDTFHNAAVQRGEAFVGFV